LVVGGDWMVGAGWAVGWRVVLVSVDAVATGSC